MGANERILRAAMGVVTGSVRHAADRQGRNVGGLCLMQVRLVVEHAVYGGRQVLYERWLKHPVPRPRTNTPWWYGPWARDVERSLRHTDMVVPGERYGPDGDPTRYIALDSALPGDLAFRWDTAKGAEPSEPDSFVGHVGVLIGADEKGEWVVLENATARQRPRGLAREATVMGPLTWPVTTIIRFNPEGRFIQ